MLSEEEKKAIEYLTEYAYAIYEYTLKSKDARIILNLIEKQQAEIEEYKTLFKRQKELEQEEETLKKQGWLK